MWPLLVGVLGLAWTALMTTALMQIAKHPTIDPTAPAVWIPIVLVALVLGAIVWFWVGQKKSATSPDQSSRLPAMYRG